MSNNRINKIAIVGATGHVGSHIVTELLKADRHEITAISRHDSKSTPPEGVKVARVDYSKEDEIVAALRGHDFLIISLGAQTAPEVHPAICNAATKAGVKWIMPNVWGMDPENTRLIEENVYGSIAKKGIAEAEAAGANYVVLACSFWYEWSVAAGLNFYGIDIKERKAVFFDDGNQKINTSTLQQCGRAVAALLRLPITKEDPAKPALEDWKNKPLYVSSFLVSQRDMLDSIHRALGTTDKDWEIASEPAVERTNKALAEMQKGNFAGFAQAMYTRFFYKTGDGPYAKEGDGNYEAVHGLANEALGLPKEDFDETNKWVVEKKLKDGFVYDVHG
ncbi:hypothetical protein N0V90_004186 [Kalmusia sp. IMI 367209]|nr:hypothetical protein N0V90_004186 [Kalmusia sp. IMI 367209]